MAWATPSTFTTGEIVTAAKLNEIRDNLRYLKGLDGIVVLSNSVKTINAILEGAGADTATISLYKDATPSRAFVVALNTIGSSPGDDLVISAYNGSAWSERFRVTNGGNVGIGGTPSNRLHIQGATAAALRIDGSGITGSPGQSSGSSPTTSYYGSNGAWLGVPSTFIAISINGTVRYVPAY